MSSPTVIIVPGWRNSGVGHWQSLWTERLPHVLRVEQDEVRPPPHALEHELLAADLAEFVRALER